MNLVYIPAGEFLMGSTESDVDAASDEKPQHSVYLDAFWIDETEVTNAMYMRCVDADICSLPKSLQFRPQRHQGSKPALPKDIGTMWRAVPGRLKEGKT